VTVARGSTIEFTGWFDNSDKNPANPNPKKNVRWGPQTTDEMLLGYVEYYIDGPGESQMVSSIVTSLGGPKGIEALFHLVDKNSDGKVTQEELPRPAIFDRLDTKPRWHHHPGGDSGTRRPRGSRRGRGQSGGPSDAKKATPGQQTRG
jgi:hypothetical protein